MQQKGFNEISDKIKEQTQKKAKGDYDYELLGRKRQKNKFYKIQKVSKKAMQENHENEVNLNGRQQKRSTLQDILKMLAQPEGNHRTTSKELQIINHKEEKVKLQSTNQRKVKS